MAAADQDRIVAAARGLIQAGGVEALSMRKLGAEVGVAPTAIYWHVGSREDLLNAVLDAMIADLPPVVARGNSPPARLASVARSIRDQVRATTPTQQLAAELGRTAELSFPGQVALTREMQAAGVGGSDAAQAVRAEDLAHRDVILEDNFAHRQPGSRTTQELWQALDDDGIDPALRKAMARPANTDTLFDYAVDQLLASVLASM